jgi:NAD(P)-dependent dehydrogenase (short-subunit alcohol dehydrogenase family)/acyl carrier protein
MAVVAEKTGYPPEMLAPEMSLDSDLGIDSIKRVEIFSALQEKLPNAPVVRPEHLGTLHTLGDVIGFLSRDLEPAAQARVSADSLACAAGSKSSAGSKVSDFLFEVIAEKTGYPAEMLAPEMALDADLGIDSIKRVEIFSALQERLPSAPVVKPEHLGSLHTLADVVAFLSESASETEIPQKKTAESRQPCESLIERSVLRAVPVKRGSPERIRLAPGSSVCLVGDSSPFCQSLRAAIEKSGLSVSTHSWNDELKEADYAGLLLVAPEHCPADLPLQGLRWMKRMRPAFQATAVFATVTRLDGTFGVRGSVSIANPECGALAGLAKTAKHEWPAVHCKAIDVAGDFPIERASEIWNEILARGSVEVGFTRPDRIELVLDSNVPATSDKLPLDHSDVVLITGGARGVTAAAALAIARRFQPTIVLLGRTNVDQAEPEALRECASEATLKKALSQTLKDATPKSIEAEYRRIIGNREVHATMHSLERAGARVKYLATDVTEPDAVGKTLQKIRTEVGPITCLIHGAGVLADRKIDDLSEDAFNRVYATKVAGLNHLLRELSHDPLKAIVLFSSSTGRFGRTGQAAYAAANESLNKIAQQQAQSRPGCKVVSINWGPWDGGMVTPALRKLFADEGVGVIPLDEGGKILVRELAAPKADVEIVVIAKAAAAEAQPAKHVYSLEREVRLSDHPILRSHIIDGRAVLPLALHLEWLAHAALHSNPGLVFHGVNDLRLLHGVQFRAGELARVRIAAGKSRKEGSLFHVPVEMYGLRNGLDIIHSRGEIILASRLPESVVPREMSERSPAALDPVTAYERSLFHGPDLQGIEAIHSIGADGIVVDCRTAPAPSNWMKQPPRSAWLADPLVLDCAFQAMIVWSASNHGAGCLPCFVGRYRQFRRSFPAGPVRLAVAITQQSGAIVRADIDVLDEHGKLIARIENHESVIDDSLNRAFQHNRLIEEPALAEGGVR